MKTDFHCPIIAIANQKGGVGKTTLTFNLAHYFSSLNFRTLVIDADPHGNLTHAFGPRIDSLKLGLHSVIEDREIPIETCYLLLSPNLTLIGSNTLLSRTTRWLGTQTNGELRLRQRLTPLRKNFDLILIDTCPGLGALLNSVLNACNSVILPVDTGIFGYLGIKELLTEMHEIQIATNPDLKVLGYVLTMTDRTVISRETWNALHSQYGKLVFDTPLRRCVGLKESPAFQKSIFEYAPHSTGAKDIESLADQILARLNQNKRSANSKSMELV